MCHILKRSRPERAGELDPFERDPDNAQIPTRDPKPPTPAVVARRAGPVGVQVHGRAQRVAELEEVVPFVAVKQLLISAPRYCCYQNHHSENKDSQMLHVAVHIWLEHAMG